MKVLGQIDGESLISLIIFGIIILNAIIQMFRHMKRRKEEAGEIERPEPVRPAPPRPSAPSPKNDLERLFEELSGKAEERAQQRQPAVSLPPESSLPPLSPQEPSMPAPAPEQPRPGIAAEYPRPVRKRKSAPSEAAIRKQAKIHQKAGPQALDVAPPMESVQAKGKKSEDLVSRMFEQLPEKPLQRAIALREVFGPCRAKGGFKPGRW